MENELHQYFVKALDDLRRIAESKMKQERKNHTLTATALMNEAFLQFREPGEGLHDTDQFVGLVGHKMQQILHDHGRRKSARKRGGDWKRSNLDPKMLDPGDDRRKDIYSDPEMFLDACELIEQLALDYPQHAELVRHLLFTPGSTLAEAGEAVGWKYENAKKKLRFAISELRRRWSADD